MGRVGGGTLPAMRRAPVLLSMSLAIVGCAGSTSPRPEEGPGLAIARAEVRRAGGVAALAAIDAPAAIRGLGRVGDPAAIDRLLALLADPARRGDAIAALGLAGALESADARVEPALLALWPGVVDPRLATALGRVGTTASVPVLTDMLAGTRPPALRTAAALALGVLGRRDGTIDAAGQAALAAAGQGDDRALARAGAYGLAHAPGGADPEGSAALVRLAGHADAEVRMWAQIGLRRRVSAAQARPCFEAALDDGDVWVRVAGVRGLAKLGEPADRARLLALVDAEGSLHPVLEALSILTDATSPPAGAAEAQVRAERRLAAAAPVDVAVRARIACQLAALVARGAEFVPPLRCAEVGGPAAERERLLAETGLLGQGAGAPGARAARLAVLAGHGDPRIRAGAVAAAARAWGEGGEEIMEHALADRSSAVAGAAAEGLQSRFTGMNRPGAPGPALVAALVRRAGAERDSELFAALAGAVAASGDRAGLPACAAALGWASPGARAAARGCVKSLTAAEPAAPAEIEAMPSPPVDPGAVIGRAVDWRIVTSRGPVDVALDPSVAPWHVAALVELTRRGFYDGLDFHRVVPGFVVQGGDPEGTGWGGPGFSLPSEPGEGRFARGAVGIADAGKDTGGSQFFVMHANAPHLEGRYTRVGEVVGGMAAVDALVVGDAIVRAEVTLRGGHAGR